MALTPRFVRGGLVVHWLEGALLFEREGEAMLVDVPAGVVPLLRDRSALGRIQTVLLTSGRTRAVEGLVPLLCALEPWRARKAPLTLRTFLGEERGPTLTAAWSRAWPDRYPLLQDGLLPGAEDQVGAFTLRTVPQRHGEPHWREDRVVPAAGVAVRVATPEATVAWVPGAAPSPAVRRACRGADLAVIEVGVEPWPRAEEPWRLSLAQALEAGAEAGEVWLVGDDGRFGLGGEEQ